MKVGTSSLDEQTTHKERTRDSISTCCRNKLSIPLCPSSVGLLSTEPERRQTVIIALRWSRSRALEAHCSVFQFDLSLACLPVRRQVIWCKPQTASGLVWARSGGMMGMCNYSGGKVKQSHSNHVMTAELDFNWVHLNLLLIRQCKFGWKHKSNLLLRNYTQRH